MRRVQIILVEKNRLGKVQSLELLLVGQESKRVACRGIQSGCTRIRRVRDIDRKSLENRDRIQIARIAGA